MMEIRQVLVFVRDITDSFANLLWLPVTMIMKVRPYMIICLSFFYTKFGLLLVVTIPQRFMIFCPLYYDIPSSIG